MKKIGQVTTPWGEADIHVTRYGKGKAIAIQLYGRETGEPFGTVSTNLPDVRLDANEVCVKVWNENEPLIAPMMDTGLFEDTGRKGGSGFVVAPIWRIKDPAMLP